MYIFFLDEHLTQQEKERRKNQMTESKCSQRVKKYKYGDKQCTMWNQNKSKQ